MEKCFGFKTLVGGATLTNGVIIDRRRHPDVLPHEHLDGYAALANEREGACAFGKIAVLAGDGIHSFQVMPDGRIAAAFCGNSTAAAVQCMDLSAELLTRVHGAGSSAYPIRARASGAGIAQSWFLPNPVVEQLHWRGRRVLILHALNDYAIVVGSLPPGLDAERARTELLGLAGCGKLAVVNDSGEIPLACFYNSNGRHGAAPQTGLASIAIAAASTEWFGRIVSAGQLSFYSRGTLRTVALPELTRAPNGSLELSIAPITVQVKRLPIAMAA